jgi:hypothetical protein
MSQNETSTSKCVSAKDNPFMVQRTDAIRFDFRETDFSSVEAFAHHVETYKFRGAILGRHGRGKTTLLCDLNSHFCEQDVDSELVFLPRGTQLHQDAVADLVRRGEDGAIVLVDGLERLSFLRRQRLITHSRTFAGFIATTHRSGRLRTLIRCRTSQRTLMAVLDSLDLNRPKIARPALALLSKRKGNVRLVLRDLYDQYADGHIA